MNNRDGQAQHTAGGSNLRTVPKSLLGKMLEFLQFDGARSLLYCLKIADIW